MTPFLFQIQESAKYCQNQRAFKNFSVKATGMEISKLSTSKSCLINRIPATIIKSNVTFFSNLMPGKFLATISLGMFPNNLKLVDIPAHKKGGNAWIKEIIDLWVYSLSDF